ncbi:hypothetical protein BM221_002091 [Beauveria bassiana]|uniref:Uncharacterized protein n=1 Tax=Beauveria bassiana TaxID=176275 RepID=A0A2N6NXJ5_BEABA|nr:hypothetical protein BM221_002091 [Beauveria bassiana]
MASQMVMGDGYTTSACSPHYPRDEDNVRPERTRRVGSGGIDSRVTPSESTAVFDVIEPVLKTGLLQT